MTLPLLSVLIASVPSRIPYPFSDLFRNLCTQAKDQPVEVLGFADNRMRSLGEKMNGLLDLARGTYLTYVDDDDAVSDSYVARILQAIRENPEAHVINYRVEVTLPDGHGYVHPSLLHENEEFRPNRVTLRKPMQTSVWRWNYAKLSRWGDGQYNVDAAWCGPLWNTAKVETNIDEVLYHYRRDKVKSEAV